MKALQRGDVDEEFITRWDEGCEAVGQAMKKMAVREKEAKVANMFGWGCGS